ncbi:MAG: 4Fe-4S dicluster domain-containing protein [Kiritimatiellales bacterium]|jgi:dissimilatory sulfite reductase (desulfoviridin) alpha/beta subunit
MEKSSTYSCNIRQKQKDYFALRLRTVGGDITAGQLRAIAGVADRFGAQVAHLSTRQGVEIHNIHKDNLKAAQEELETAGLCMGADGNRVRIVIACPGNSTCRYGSIDTKVIAAGIDRRYFRMDTPYKFKIGITGCPNNCGKARESDLGIMGGRTPVWLAEPCTHCNACVKTCPVQAIACEDEKYVRDPDKCINCSVCTAVCPAGAWKAESFGHTILIGGTLGKKPRLAVPLKKNIQDAEELFELVDRCVRFYRRHGRPKERLGHLMDRLGEAHVIQAVLDGNIEQE